MLAEIKAYILCRVNSGAEKKVSEEIAKYSFVSEVNKIYGEYDIIVSIRVDDLQQLDFVIDKIRMIPNITFTSTMIVGREYKYNGKKLDTRKLSFSSLCLEP